MPKVVLHSANMLVDTARRTPRADAISLVGLVAVAGAALAGVIAHTVPAPVDVGLIVGSLWLGIGSLFSP